ncbi:uncharacterized protein LOC118277457 [Spodoptera frugiperda]|uniref:Uncharacterized protein LOC118277457 n=1 Tax=Spodoptera frugiperda TaxID=7108 RepID=A0A9R0DG92_SPOFR|nr:uncharacterized protein LOC118277457 [Spodoptera frugiperda]
MFKEFHIKICVIILVHLHIAWSYRVYHLDADEENEVLSELKRALQGYQIPSYGEARPRQSRHRLKPVGKSMFVKRIVPHGYRTGEYEYDSRLNTVFRPLFRYHIAKPSDGQERSVEREIKPNQKMSINDLISFLKKEPNPQPLLPFIKKYIQQDLEHKRKRKKNKKRFSSLLNKLSLKDELKLLRLDYEKSGELNDPFAPGKLPHNYLPDQVEGAEDKPVSKVHYPEYPFWNYWTYEKTIVQDNCPANLVKEGNMCVSPIGHRRNARRFTRLPKRKSLYRVI